jgi:hypothetical protein
VFVEKMVVLKVRREVFQKLVAVLDRQCGAKYTAKLAR